MCVGESGTFLKFLNMVICSYFKCKFWAAIFSNFDMFIVYALLFTCE